MFGFAPYVLKSLWRHRARTALTVSGSAVALFVFCMVGSVQQGMAQLTEDHEAARTLIVFQENRFCPSSSRLPQDYAREIGKMPGVENVVPIKVYTNNCRASLDVIVFNGMPAEKLQSARNLQLVSGSWSDFKGRTDAAMVGAGVAQRRGLSAGDKFSIGGVTVTVVGVFRSLVAAEESLIYTHLDFLQRIKGRESVGTVTLFEVGLRDNAPWAMDALDWFWRSWPRRPLWRCRTGSRSMPCCKLLDCGGLLLLAMSGFSVGAEGVTIAFRPSWELAITGAVITAGVGILAGIAPGWQAARTEIVAGLRHV